MPALIGTSLELGMRSCFPRRLAPQVSRTPMPTSSSFPPSRAVRGDVVRFPGVTIDSTQAVRRLLTENNRRFHIYQKISFQHNHLAHHLLAAYSLGASPDHLQAILAADEPHMAPLERWMEWGDNDALIKGGNEAAKAGREAVVRDPPLVNEDNWWHDETLGKSKYYGAYLQFFHRETARLGIKAALERYVMGCDKNEARMFVRFLAGAFHPFIHTGYAVEFDDPVVFAEALAQTAVHSPDILAPLVETDSIANTGDTSLLEIYTSLCESPVADPGPYDPDALINARMRTALQGGRAEELQRLAGMWRLDETMDEAEWQDKIGEMGVLATLLACATDPPGADVKVDFFLMHCLTSSIFLPSLVLLLDPPARVRLMRSYLLVVLHMSLCRGRPRIYVEALQARTAFPEPPSSLNVRPSEIVGDPDAAQGGNPWLAIVQSAMYAQDSHVIKSIRSLVYWASRYGHLPAGELPGKARKLSGDIFQRAAGVIMQQMGWCREGEPRGEWDMSAKGWGQ